VRHLIRTLILAAGFLGLLAPAAVAGDWTVGEITGPAGTTRIEPTAVNGNGVVVGHARFPGESVETAFRWEDGQMVQLPLNGFAYSRAADINDDGTVVGWVGTEQPCCTLSYSTNAAIWTTTTSTSSLSLPPFTTYGQGFTTTGADKDRGSALAGINNPGQVVGGAAFAWISPFNNPNQNASYTVFPTVGTFSRLALPDTLNATTGGTVYGGRAAAINDRGDIMGDPGPGASRIWYAGAGTGTEYDVYAGKHGFNDEAHIAGRTGILSGSGTSQDYRALLWNGSDYVQIGANQSQSIANAVNNSDWAVGRAGVFESTQPRTAGNAWLWRPGEAPTTLFALAPTGWSMANATDINDDGMIVGAGKHDGVEMGFWMAPASIAHKLSGAVYGPGGAPLAGARLRITNAAGTELAAPTTGADGTYSATLNRGGPYDITALPEGSYLPDGLAGCTIVGAACRLNLSRNRTVDFYATAIAVPGAGANPPPVVAQPALRRPSAGSVRSGKAGAQIISVSVPGPGRLTAIASARLPTAGAAAGSRPKQATVATGSARATRAGTINLTLKPTRAAQRLLKAGRSLRANVKITFTSTGGTRTTITKRVTFKVKTNATKPGRKT
jgi:uncharacterized membrane protein